jgi:hypothetical protein
MVRSFSGNQDIPGNPVEMINRMIGDMPIIKLVGFSQGSFTMEMLDQIITEANE